MKRILFLSSWSRFALFIFLIGYVIIAFTITHGYTTRVSTPVDIVGRVKPVAMDDGAVSYVIIAKNPTHGTFSISATAAAYHKAGYTRRMNFMLSQFDIKQSNFKDMLNVSAAFACSAIVVFLILSVLYYYDPNDQMIIFVRTMMRGGYWATHIKRFPNDPRGIPHSWPQKNVSFTA